MECVVDANRVDQNDQDLGSYSLDPHCLLVQRGQSSEVGGAGRGGHHHLSEHLNLAGSHAIVESSRNRGFGAAKHHLQTSKVAVVCTGVCVCVFFFFFFFFFFTVDTDQFMWDDVLRGWVRYAEMVSCTCAHSFC